MFREMRRNRQMLTQEECIRILETDSSGVLAVLGDEDYPYTVPLSYVYDSQRLYFHCALSGHKLDAVQKHDKASFCVIHQDLIVPEEYTTHYQSVIAFGRVKILQDESEKWDAAVRLARRYAPDDSDLNRENVIKKSWNALCMLEMTIEHLSGKRAKELADSL